MILPFPERYLAVVHGLAPQLIADDSAAINFPTKCTCAFSATFVKEASTMKSATQQPANSTRQDENEAVSNGSIPAAGVLNQVEAARFLHVQPRTLESWR